jgi:O-antigen ligase
LIATLGVVLWLAKADIWRRYGLVLALAVLPALHFSESATSVLTAISAIAGAAALRFLFRQDKGRWRIALDIRVLVVIVIPIVVISAVGLIGIETILGAFGKSITLSGRTKLWAYAFNLGLEHPILGAGYRDFWTDRLTATFTQLFYWDDAREGMEFSGPGNGHNGYLDLFLELGLIGVVFYAALQVSALSRIARCFMAGLSREGWALAMIFCFLLTYSIAEKVILQHTEGVWFLFMTFYLYAGRALQLRGRP